jgi:hypothetical protein
MHRLDGYSRDLAASAEALLVLLSDTSRIDFVMSRLEELSRSLRTASLDIQALQVSPYLQSENCVRSGSPHEALNEAEVGE